LLMVHKKTLSSLVAGLIAVAVIAVAVGLPFSQFGVKGVDAQYSPGAIACARAASYQIRFYGDVVAYADPALTQPVLTIPGNTRIRQKYLICPESLTEDAGSLQIAIAGALVWVAADTGDIVPRSYRDNQ
jgi:hypothetical protein